MGGSPRAKWGYKGGECHSSKSQNTRMNVAFLKRRILEIIPGGLVWFTLIAAFVVSFMQPLWAIYFIILFDLYWLLRVLYFIIFLVYSWTRYHKALKVHWSDELQTKCPEWRDYWQLIFLPTYK